MKTNQKLKQKLKRDSLKKTIKIICIFTIPFLFFSCISFTKPLHRNFLKSSDLSFDSDASKKLFDLGLINDEIYSSKGIGSLTIFAKNKSYSSSFAWICEFPDSIRLDILSPLGTPIHSISSDGKYFYIISYSENKFYKKKVKEAFLKNIMGLPIDQKNILFFLLGKIPIYSHKKSTLDKFENSSHITLEDIQDNKKTPIEKIYLDNNNLVNKIDFFDFNGKMTYNAKITFNENETDYKIPKTIKFSNKSEDIFCKFNIRIYKINPAILTEVFVLDQKVLQTTN